MQPKAGTIKAFSDIIIGIHIRDLNIARKAILQLV